MCSTNTQETPRVPSLLSLLLKCISLAVVSALAHPGWYGDAIWYARDLATSEFSPDFGHLLWRPLGQVFYSLNPLWDPLLTLQTLSLSFTFFLLVGLGLCCRVLELNARVTLSLLVLFTFTNFNVSYGYSGSSYSAAAACLTWALFASLRGKSAIAGILGGLGFGFWALGALAFLSVPYILYRERGIRSSLLALLSAGAVVIFIIALFFLSQSESNSLGSWAQSSGHGIATSLSVTGLFRALLGLVLCFGFVGEISLALKSLLFHDPEVFEATFSLPPVLLLSVSSLAALGALASSLFSLTKRQKTLLGATLIALAPNFLFAAIWQGSDVERFSPSLPIMILFLGSLARQRTGLVLSLSLTALLVSNLLFRVMPPLLDATARSDAFAQSVSSLEKPTLLIMTGQTLGTQHWAPAIYFHQIDTYHFLYEYKSNQLKHWKTELRRRIDATLASGGKIYVLDQLIGLSPEKKSHYIPQEYPVPTRIDEEAIFGDLVRGESLRLNGYRFYRFHGSSDRG